MLEIDDIGKRFGLLYGYAILLGFIYSFSYWKFFSIEILTYINLGDLIKFSLMPLLYISIPLLIGLTLIEFFFHSHKPPTKEQTDNAVNITPVIILLALLALPFLTYFYVMHKIENLIYVAIFISVPIYFFLKYIVSVKFTDSDSLNSVLIYMVLILPWAAYDIGKPYAKHTLKSNKYEATMTLDGNKYSGISIGHINDYYFIKTNNDVLIIHNPFLVVQDNKIMTIYK